MVNYQAAAGRITHSLTLEDNNPVEVPPDQKTVGPTTQAESYLQIQNLSGDNVASYFVTAGSALNKSGDLATTAEVHWVKNFNGSELVVANVSTTGATLKVTLISS